MLITRPATRAAAMLTTIAFSLAVWAATGWLILNWVARPDEAHLCAVLAIGFGLAGAIGLVGLWVAVGRGM